MSPSDNAVTRSLVALRETRGAPHQTRRTRAVDPNELAVALWVEAEGKRVLLGADLLAGPDGCGWGAILSTIHESGRASVFKVPHHGAPNAHHENVWVELLEEDPVVLLAPFRAGVTRRPSQVDIDRICGLTSRAFITASPAVPARSKAVRRSAGVLSQLARDVRDPWGKSGHVRARSRAGSSSWTIRMSPPARALCG